jgi:DNA replication and repair protein RecF
MVSDNSFGQVFITDTSTTRVKTIFDEIGVSVKLFKVKEGEIDAQD